MPVLQDYECESCAKEFDTWDDEAVCPHCGSSDCEITFVSPRGVLTSQTRQTDKDIKTLTKECGLTDYNNNPSTKHDPPAIGYWQDVKADKKQQIGTNISLGVPSADAINHTVANTIHSDKFYNALNNMLAPMQKQGLFTHPATWQRQYER